MKFLLTTLLVLVVLTLAGVMIAPDSNSDNTRLSPPAKAPGDNRAAAPAPARLEDSESDGEPSAARAWSEPAAGNTHSGAPGSGFEDLPAERVRRVESAGQAPGIGEDVVLALPDRKPTVLRVGGDFQHPNGDISVHARGDGPGRTRATLTWGRQGMFGRVQADDALYLVHSDATGSWLIDLDDERIAVDNFHGRGDTLGQSIAASANDATRPSDGDHARGELLEGPPAQSASHSPSQIDVMFVYPQSMLERYPDGLIETRLNHLVAIANQAMVDSDVPVVVNLVHHQRIDDPAQAANHPTLQDLGRALAGEHVPEMVGLKSAREAHGADIVALTWPHDIETRGSCGVAYFPRSRESGGYDPAFGTHIDNDGASNWSVCSDAVFTHELGHNLNAAHQRSQSGDNAPERDNHAFVRSRRFHTVMGSFGTGDVNRYLRLDVFSNPEIRCGGAPCGSSAHGEGANNAAALKQFGPIVAGYGGANAPNPPRRPDPSDPDSDDDGLSDWDDPYPFDPHDGQPVPETGPVTDFSPRALRPADQPGSHELLVVSSGTDQVLSFNPDGTFRAVVTQPEAADGGPILTEFSDMHIDGEGRLYLLASGDVRRYDRLSGRLIDVFLGSTRPVPADLASPFPRAFSPLPQNRFAVLGGDGIERFDANSGNPLGQPSDDEPTTDPINWRDAMDLPLRGLAIGRQTLYVVEAAQNRIMAFSLTSGQRQSDLASSNDAPIEDPRALRMGPDGLLYLANGRASNILRFDPDGGGFVDTFVASGSGGLDFARDLAFSPDGDLFVTSHAGNEVLRFDGQTGAFIETVVSAESGRLEAPVALAFAPVIDEIDTGHSGHFFVPERSGEGWLLEILDDESAAISWFTYPPAQSGRSQAWMVGIGDIIGNRIVFEEILETRAASFGPDFDPEALELIDWGRLELEFSHCNSGWAEYQANDPAWGSGRHHLTRLIGIKGRPCGARARSPDVEAPGISGQWYDPDANGQGWFLEEHASGRVFMAWYTYDDGGDQAWIVGEGEMIDRELVVDELLMPSGTNFGEAFDPDAVDQRHWGSLRMEFQDCERALVTYDSEIDAFGQGSKTAKRLTTLDKLDCRIE